LCLPSLSYVLLRLIGKHDRIRTAPIDGVIRLSCCYCSEWHAANPKGNHGKVSNIAVLAQVADMNSPSVIVVGEVVNYLHTLNAITQEVIVHYQ
ncbi:MAG: hypothetical protein QM762_09980, partial [Chryseolinea sp.]